MNAFDVLLSRGLIKQHTDADALRRAFAAGPVTFYVGFDPTATSLHIGNLVPIMAMTWLQKLGHKPIVVMGGGTGMVGDPSGKDKARELMSPATIRQNLLAQRWQFGRFLDLMPEEETPFSSDEWTDGRGIVRDNADWLLPLHYISFLREVGRHFSINHMLTAAGTKQRLDRGQGLSFIEFNYHLLQSYDYLVLHRAYHCTLQMGGDDQWFHILGGCELVRRMASDTAHGVTFPLVERSDGKKMGKSESGAIWLDATMCSPYHYYQFWLNVPDADVGRFLRTFTFLPLDRIHALDELEGAQIREAKLVLAWEATALAHGEDEARRAKEASLAAFSGGVSEDMPCFATAFPRTVVDVLVESGLCASKNDARRQIEGGGVYIGEDKVTDLKATVSGPCVLWRGKKSAVRLVTP